MFTFQRSALKQECHLEYAVLLVFWYDYESIRYTNTYSNYCQISVLSTWCTEKMYLLPQSNTFSVVLNWKEGKLHFLRESARFAPPQTKRCGRNKAVTDMSIVRNPLSISISLLKPIMLIGEKGYLNVTFRTRVEKIIHFWWSPSGQL